MVDRCEVCGITFADAKIYIRRGKAMCGKCAERIELEDWQYQVTATEAIATLQSELAQARTANAMQAKTIERLQAELEKREDWLIERNNELATANGNLINAIKLAKLWHGKCLEARALAAELGTDDDRRIGNWCYRCGGNVVPWKGGQEVICQRCGK